MILKKRQSGLALITALIVSTIVLIVTSVLVYKVASNGKDIVRRENEDKSLQFAESAIHHLLNKMTDLSYSSSNVSNAGRLTAAEIAQQVHTTDWIDTTNNTKFSTKSGYSKDDLSSDSFITSLNTNPNHSTLISNFFSNTNYSIQNTASSTAQNTSNNLGLKLFTYDSSSNPNAVSNIDSANFKLDSLHEKGYTTYHYVDDSKGQFQADFKISVLPIRTNIKNRDDVELHGGGTNGNGSIMSHYDIMKIRAIAYIPSIENPKVTKTLDLIINRPIKLGDSVPYNFAHAILTGGNADLGNKDTTSGTTSTTLDTEQHGDVHANGDLTFGANGKVNGKATAGGTVHLANGDVPTTTYDSTNSSDPRFSTTQVTDKDGTKSGVNEFPIPDFDVSGLPTTPCPAVTNDAILIDCIVTGDLNISGNMDVQFQGTVYITGNLTQSGNTNLNTTGTTAVRVVVGDGVTSNTGAIDLAGGSNNANTKEALFISRALPNTQAITIRGNPGTTGANGSVFVSVNENTTSTISGNVSFFGALITKGDVNSNGNSGGIKRDSDLSALEAFVVPHYDRSAFRPQIVSWQEIKK